MDFIERIFRILEGVLHAFIELIMPIANPCHHEGVLKLAPHFRNKLCIHLPTAVVGSTTKTHTLLKSFAPIPPDHVISITTKPQQPYGMSSNNLHSNTHPVGSDMSSPVACTLAHAQHNTFARTNIATPSTFGGAHPHMAGLVITHAIMCFIAFIRIKRTQKFLQPRTQKFCSFCTNALRSFARIFTVCVELLCCCIRCCLAVLCFSTIMHLSSYGWLEVLAYPLVAYMHCTIACCVLWLSLYVLYCPSQPSSAAWYFAVISNIINNTSVIIVYCFGLFAAIGAEVVASTAPRATLVGRNAETIATLWVRGGAALVTITLISVNVSSTSVNTVNIASNSDQPDQKTRHDERSETQAPEGSNPSSGSHGLPSPSIVANELSDDFKSCHACSCNDSCNSSLRSAVSCPLSIIESFDGSDCDDRVVNDNTFFFSKPEQGEPHAPVFGTQHNCSHARVSQWLDDNLPAQSTGLEGCDSPHADAHSNCLCKHSPPSLVHPNGTPTLESEYHRPCAGSRSENSTANAVDDTGSTSDCCKCTGSSSGDGGVPGPVDRPARRPDQLTIGPAVTVRAASDVEDWILAISMVWSTLSCPTHMICLVAHLP
jgi:hypothetical protein